MMNPTRARSELSLPTSRLESLTTIELDEGATAAPATAPGRVVFLDVYQTQDHPIPDGFMEIDAAVEEQERDLQTRTGIARARTLLAEQLPIERHSLAFLRLRRGMSQKQLADAIGTSQPHIARIEAGNDNLLLKTANALAKALNSTLEEVNRALGCA